MKSRKLVFSYSVFSLSICLKYKTLYIGTKNVISFMFLKLRFLSLLSLIVLNLHLLFLKIVLFLISNSDKELFLNAGI